LVERVIGDGNAFLHRYLRLQGRDAERSRDVDRLAAIELDGEDFQSGTQPFQNIDRLRGLDVGQTQQEFLAAVTVDRIVGTQRLDEILDRRAQYLVAGAIDRGLIPLAVVILLGSILAGIYVWKVVEIVYFKPVVDSSAEITEAPWSLVLPAWTLIGASLYFGVDASLSSSLAQRAARLLLAQS